jgi:NADH:ubiquinone oxidoreductase subunit 4 (subunit M)
LIVYIILFLGTVGIIDATIKLFSQQDLKKIVALTTIIEMN